MIDRIAGPRKCVLALGGLLGLFLLLSLALAWPLSSKNNAFDEEIEKSSAQLRRYRDIVAERPELRATLQQLKRSAGQSRYYVSAGTSALGAAELQKRAKQVIEAHGGELTSTQALPAKYDGNTVRIAIGVRMQLGVESLGDVLYRLEGGRPLLFVENLSVRSRQLRGRRTKAKQITAMSVVLDVRCDLVGYMQETKE